ncbi:MAG: response regulator transcription factor [Bryobacteraceae bacterium]
MLNMEEIQPETSLKPRILVADDHFLIAETISMILAPHFDVVGVVTEAKLVADEVARLRPEVALLDVTMPGLNGLDVARMILEQAPNTRIVFLTMHANRVIVEEAFRAGASAFVVKNCSASDLVLAIRTVMAGGTYVSPEVQEDRALASSEELSERQTTVLSLIAQGCSAKQIAFHLNISSRTAEFHKSAIMEKLNLRTNAQLTRYAIERGIGSYGYLHGGDR